MLLLHQHIFTLLLPSFRYQKGVLDFLVLQLCFLKLFFHLSLLLSLNFLFFFSFLLLFPNPTSFLFLLLSINVFKHLMLKEFFLLLFNLLSLLKLLFPLLKFMQHHCVFSLRYLNLHSCLIHHLLVSFLTNSKLFLPQLFSFLYNLLSHLLLKVLNFLLFLLDF